MDVISAIEDAKTDDDIEGIILNGIPARMAQSKVARC
jgi:hypothetical protein